MRPRVPATGARHLKVPNVVLVHHNAATHNAAMHNASFSQRYPYPFFLQRHRCDALPCFSASPVEIFHIAHIALRPLLPFFLSPQWFTVQNNKKFAKSHNAAMSPLATRDGQRNAQRTTQRCGALRMWLGEGAKGVLDPGREGLPGVFCTTETCFAPVQKRPLAPLAQKTCCTLS